MDDVTAQNIMLKLNEWRKAGIKCDVILIIDEQEFHAHKNILAATIKFFEKLFTGDFAEKEKNPITLKDIDPNGFRLILDYIYTKEIEIDDDNFEQVLSVADYYQIECLMKKLFDYVKDDINTGNGFYYYHLADCVGNERIKQFTKEFIREDFISCSNSAAFLDVTYAVLLEFIDSSIQIELDRFKIIMNWIQYDSNKRSDYLSHLIEHVRFEYISNEEVVVEILDYQLIINSPEIIQTINKRKKAERPTWIYGMDGSYLIKLGIVNAEVITIHLMAKAEVNYDKFKIAYCADAIYICTYISQSGNILYRFKDSQWNHLANADKRYEAYQSIVYSEEYETLYLANEYDILCYKYDKLGASCNKNYTKDEDKRIGRICGSLVCYNNFIYTAASSRDGLYYIIRYDPLNESVHFMRQLLKPCPKAVSAALEDKMFIISGGFTQMYDITKDQCTLIEQNKYKDISYHSLIGYQNRLYAIREKWDVIDVYDLLKQNWAEEIDLKRSNRPIFNIK